MPDLLLRWLLDANSRRSITHIHTSDKHISELVRAPMELLCHIFYHNHHTVFNELYHNDSVGILFRKFARDFERWQQQRRRRLMQQQVYNKLFEIAQFQLLFHKHILHDHGDWAFVFFARLHVK